MATRLIIQDSVITKHGIDRTTSWREEPRYPGLGYEYHKKNLRGAKCADHILGSGVLCDPSLEHVSPANDTLRRLPVNYKANCLPNELIWDPFLKESVLIMLDPLTSDMDILENQS